MKCSESPQPEKQKVEQQLSGAGRKGDKIMESVKGHKTSFEGGKNVLELDSAGGCATLWMH